jgi:hypothetical protein
MHLENVGTAGEKIMAGVFVLKIEFRRSFAAFNWRSSMSGECDMVIIKCGGGN